MGGGGAQPSAMSGRGLSWEHGFRIGFKEECFALLAKRKPQIRRLTALGCAGCG